MARCLPSLRRPCRLTVRPRSLIRTAEFLGKTPGHPGSERPAAGTPQPLAAQWVRRILAPWLHSLPAQTVFCKAACRNVFGALGRRLLTRARIWLNFVILACILWSWGHRLQYIGGGVVFSTPQKRQSSRPFFGLIAVSDDPWSAETTGHCLYLCTSLGKDAQGQFADGGTQSWTSRI